jgi:hypothetical protein
MFRGVTDILEVLRDLVPTPVLIGILVVVMALATPAWLRSVRTRQMKGKLRTAARARSAEERASAVEGAFSLAKGKPRALVDLAERAMHNGQVDVWRRALAELEATGKLELDLVRLRRKVAGPDKRVRDPLQAAVRIERLIEAGLVVGARETLDELAKSHPDSRELAQLEHDVRAAEARAAAAARERYVDPSEPESR